VTWDQTYYRVLSEKVTHAARNRLAANVFSDRSEAFCMGCQIYRSLGSMIKWF
jgi:hypothetical protein